MCLPDIELFDVDEDILTLITIDPPKTVLKMILKDPLEDVKIADVRYLNSADRVESSTNEGVYGL